MYIIPATVVSTYIVFNMYPGLARRMHQRKLTYEDLEVMETNDPVLMRRFQIVFTRVQQIGGSICAGIVVAYAWSQYHLDADPFVTFGVLGGLLSLYARVFGYVGGFCISCLYKIKREERYTTTNDTRFTKTGAHPNPNAIKPQDTKNSDEIL
jgi:hypothetical protein